MRGKGDGKEREKKKKKKKKKQGCDWWKQLTSLGEEPMGCKLFSTPHNKRS